MRSFIRFNGTETSMDNVHIVDQEFNNMMIAELHKVFGVGAQFLVAPAANFVNEAQTDNIFSGIITGQFESEAPVNISVYTSTKLDRPVGMYDKEDRPDADMAVPAFLGFRK